MLQVPGAIPYGVPIEIEFEVVNASKVRTFIPQVLQYHTGVTSKIDNVKIRKGTAHEFRFSRTVFEVGSDITSSFLPAHSCRTSVYGDEDTGKKWLPFTVHLTEGGIMLYLFIHRENDDYGLVN